MEDFIKLYPFKCFVSNTQEYLFTSNNNRLLKVDKEIANMLRKVEKNNFILNKNDVDNYNLDSTITLLENYELVNNERCLQYSDNGQFYNMVLMISQLCNLNCLYCYGDEGEYQNKGKMHISTAKVAVDFLLDNCGNRSKVYIVFFGGEPLLNKELIFELVEYLELIELEKGIQIGKSMTTNGTLITEELANYCEKKKINIKISIDGPEEVNDKYRVYKNGQGSYRDIMKNTSLLREKKLVSARATITPFCLDQNYIEESLEKEGFVSPGSDYAKELLEDEDYFRIYKYNSINFDNLSYLIEQKQYKYIKEKNSRAFLYIKLIHKSSITNFRCGTGRNMYAVDINGDLYPCQRFVGKKEFRVGDIFNGVNKREDFLNEININNQSHIKCNLCWIKNLCLGTCPYTCFSLTGNVSNNLDIYCKLMKTLYADAVKIYLNLSDIDKQNLFY